MRAVASTKGQIVIPAALRRTYGIKKGTPIEVREGAGHIMLFPKTPQALDKLLDALEGKYAGEPLVRELMAERRRDRQKEDAGWTPPRVR